MWSKCRMIKSLDRIVLSMSNSIWCSGNHKKVRPFPVSCRSATVWCRKSGTKNANYLHRPRNERTEVWSVGTGNLDNAEILAGSGLTPEDETTHPAKLRHVSTWNFHFNNATCSFSQCCTTCEIQFSNSEGEVAQIKISSTIFRHHGKPSTTRSECQHHSSDEDDKPMGALK